MYFCPNVAILNQNVTLVPNCKMICIFTLFALFFWFTNLICLYAKLLFRFIFQLKQILEVLSKRFNFDMYKWARKNWRKRKKYFPRNNTLCCIFNSSFAYVPQLNNFCRGPKWFSPVHLPTLNVIIWRMSCNHHIFCLSWISCSCCIQSKTIKKYYKFKMCRSDKMKQLTWYASFECKNKHHHTMRHRNTKCK